MRGSVFSLEIFIAIAMAAAMAWVMLTYVDSKLDSTGYFQEFYAKDLSLFADTIASGPGKVTATYDNIKRLPLTYAFTQEHIVRVLLGEFAEERGFGVQEGVTVVPYSGSPEFLAFSKTDSTFTVSEATSFLETCTKVPRTLELRPGIESAQGLQELTNGMKETMELAFREATPKINDDATIIFEVVEGETFVVEYGSDEESTYLGCVLASQLDAFTSETVERKQSTLEKGRIRITADMNKQVLGQVLGRTVVLYAR